MAKTFDHSLFDLEPRDLRVYESLLANRGSASIRSVANSSGMNRGTVYEVIKKLSKAGLVSSHYRGARLYYVAEGPESMRLYTANRLHKVEQEMQNVNSYVDGLHQQNLSHSEEQFTRFYDGDEEIAVLLRDVLDTTNKLDTKEYSVISSSEISSKLYKKFSNFTEQRIKRGIFTKVIAVGKPDDVANLAQRRWLRAEQTPASYVILYGGKVAYISLSKSDKIQGVVIENDGLFRLQSLVFEHLWQTLSQ